MKLNRFFLLTFLFSTTFCSGASHEDREEDPFSSVRRVESEWRKKAENQGLSSLERIREAASFKLASAWNAYRDLQLARNLQREADIPTAEEMVAHFFDQHQRESLDMLIGSIVFEWESYLERTLQSQKTLSAQETKSGFPKETGRRRKSSGTEYCDPMVGFPAQNSLKESPPRKGDKK